jgi:hypothetical protein
MSQVQAVDRSYKVMTAENDRVCAYSLKQESELSPGKKLHMCSKCKETFYSDRNSQKKHWPIHKHACCAIEKDEGLKSVQDGFESFEACCRYIKYLLDDPHARIKGRNFLYALQQFRSYLVEEQIYTGKKATQKKKVEALCTANVLHPFSFFYESGNSRMKDWGYRGEKVYKLLWASPGFACYVLSDTFLLSPAMKTLKDNGLAPPEPERFLRHGVIDPQTMHDPVDQLSEPFAHIFQSIFFCTAVSMQKSEIGLGAGVMAKTMRLWNDPYARGR